MIFKINFLIYALVFQLLTPLISTASEDLTTSEIAQQIACLESGLGDKCYENHIVNWKKIKYKEWYVSGITNTWIKDVKVFEKIPFTTLYQYVLYGKYGSNICYFTQNGHPWGIAIEFITEDNIEFPMEIKTGERAADILDYTERYDGYRANLYTEIYELNNKKYLFMDIAYDNVNNVFFSKKSKVLDNEHETTIEYIVYSKLFEKIERAVANGNTSEFRNINLTEEEKNIASMYYPDELYEILCRLSAREYYHTEKIGKKLLPKEYYNYIFTYLPKKRKENEINKLETLIAGAIVLKLGNEFIKGVKKSITSMFSTKRSQNSNTHVSSSTTPTYKFECRFYCGGALRLFDEPKDKLRENEAIIYAKTSSEAESILKEKYEKYCHDNFGYHSGQSKGSYISSFSCGSGLIY